MQDTETETAVDQGDQTSLPDPSSTEATPPDATPEGAAGPEVTPAGQGEGEKPAPETQQPPWAPSDDPYQDLEHEAYQPVLRRRDADIREEASRQARAEAERTFNREEASTVVDRVSGLLGTGLENLADQNPEGANRAMDRIKDILDRYGPRVVEAKTEQAEAAALGRAATFFRDEVLTQGMSLKAKHEFQDFARQQSGEGAWKAVLNKREELLLPAIEARLENQITQRLEKEAQARGEQQNPPPATPTGGSGTGGTDLRQARQDYAEGRLSTTEAERLGIVK